MGEILNGVPITSLPGSSWEFPQHLLRGLFAEDPVEGEGPRWIGLHHDRWAVHEDHLGFYHRKMVVFHQNTMGKP